MRRRALFITLPLVAALILACGGTGSIAPPPKRQAQPEPTAPEPSVKNEPELPWIDASEHPAIHGDLEVMIVSAQVKRVDLMDFGTLTISSDPYLVLLVGLENMNKNRLIEYRSWQESTIFGERPKLKDNLGNEYRLVQFGFGAEIIGHAKKRTLYADKIKGDVLVFERPVPGAESLHLELPLANLGNKGTLRFIIPRGSAGFVGMVDKSEQLKREKEKPAPGQPGKPTPKEPPPRTAEEKMADEATRREQLASSRLQFIEDLIGAKKTEVAVRRLNLLIEEFPETKATVRAREILKKLTK